MKGTSDKTIYFITGASGVGKTTLLETLFQKYRNKPWSFIHFDSIGIPSLEEMTKRFGSPSAWQKFQAFASVDRLIEEYHSEKIFIEGQVSPQFIRDAFGKHYFNQYRIVVIDCSEPVMADRLASRQQAELYTEDMRKWARFLREEATGSGAVLLDSSNLSPESLLTLFERAVGL